MRVSHTAASQLGTGVELTSTRASSLLSGISLLTPSAPDCSPARSAAAEPAGTSCCRLRTFPCPSMMAIRRVGTQKDSKRVASRNGRSVRGVCPGQGDRRTRHYKVCMHTTRAREGRQARTKLSVMDMGRSSRPCRGAPASASKSSSSKSAPPCPRCGARFLPLSSAFIPVSCAPSSISTPPASASPAAPRAPDWP